MMRMASLPGTKGDKHAQVCHFVPATLPTWQPMSKRIFHHRLAGDDPHLGASRAAIFWGVQLPIMPLSSAKHLLRRIGMRVAFQIAAECVRPGAALPNLAL